MKAALTFKNQPVQFSILTEKKKKNSVDRFNGCGKCNFIKFSTHSHFKKS